jgi:hypothetical protein
MFAVSSQQVEHLLKVAGLPPQSLDANGILYLFVHLASMQFAMLLQSPLPNTRTENHTDALSDEWIMLCNDIWCRLLAAVQQDYHPEEDISSQQTSLSLLSQAFAGGSDPSMCALTPIFTLSLQLVTQAHAVGREASGLSDLDKMQGSLKRRMLEGMISLWMKMTAEFAAGINILLIKAEETSAAYPRQQLVGLGIQSGELHRLTRAGRETFGWNLQKQTFNHRMDLRTAYRKRCSDYLLFKTIFDDILQSDVERFNQHSMQLSQQSPELYSIGLQCLHISISAMAMSWNLLYNSIFQSPDFMHLGYVFESVPDFSACFGAKEEHRLFRAALDPVVNMFGGREQDFMSSLMYQEICTSLSNGPFLPISEAVVPSIATVFNLKYKTSDFLWPTLSQYNHYQQRGKPSVAPAHLFIQEVFPHHDLNPPSLKRWSIMALSMHRRAVFNHSEQAQLAGFTLVPPKAKRVREDNPPGFDDMPSTSGRGSGPGPRGGGRGGRGGGGRSRGAQRCAGAQA